MDFLASGKGALVFLPLKGNFFPRPCRFSMLMQSCLVTKHCKHLHFSLSRSTAVVIAEDLSIGWKQELFLIPLRRCTPRDLKRTLQQISDDYSSNLPVSADGQTE